MIKKLLFALLIGLSFLFLFKTDFANAADCFTNLSICNSYFKTNYKSVCCRDGGCSSLCGTLDKWEYCYVECCYYRSTSRKDCYYYGNYYYCDIKWYFKRTKCSVADSCNGTVYLQPGICSDSGCSKGGNYKICCRPDGSSCTCTGGNNSGTCPSGCPHAGPNVTTCPVQCSCSWVNKGCGQGGCGSGQRLERYECNISSCSGNGQTRCVDDSSCCSCGGWSARGCGEGNCGSLQRRYTRDCNPDGCQSESKCENDSSCCQCGGWSNGACGAAGGYGQNNILIM